MAIRWIRSSVELVSGNVVRVLTFQAPTMRPHVYDYRCRCEGCRERHARDLAYWRRVVLTARQQGKP